MKIFLPFVVKEIGGTSSFAKKFAAGMEQAGHTVTFEETTDYDALLCIAETSLTLLQRAKMNRHPIIQRLDGLNYWSVAPSLKDLAYNIKIALIRHYYTNYTIYQSYYSQYCSQYFLGKKRGEKSRIIYNGVDTEHFSPEGPIISLRQNPDQTIFFTASDFRRTDQLFPILKALSYYHDHINKNFRLVLAGSFRRELVGFEANLSQYPWVEFLGTIDNSNLPGYLRGVDVFLFTHLNPPCPNNIIEALSVGLPVCGIADGSMPELVQNEQTGYLLPTKGQAFWQRRSINPQALAELIHKTVQERETLSKNARVYALKHFSLKQMVAEYVQAFESIKH